MFLKLVLVYVCVETGRDGQDATGDVSGPYATLLHAIMQSEPEGKSDQRESAAEYFVRKDKDSQYEPAAKNAMKKAKSQVEILSRKLSKSCSIGSTNSLSSSSLEDKLDALDAAKKVALIEDDSLPPAIPIKIRDAVKARLDKTRVKISGWVHRIRHQGKSMIFVVLRDGTGFLQCFLDQKMVPHIHIGTYKCTQGSNVY